jgi:hypothetical protein
VTLLELMLVMAILALVLGSGLGMFAALDLGKRQAAGLVKNALRSAQNSAIAREAPARVRFDRAAGLVVAESLQVIGTWHFEGRRLEGALGLDGGVHEARFIEDGFLGDALSFDGRTGAWAEIPVQSDPAFDFARGFAVRCAVLRDQTGAGRLLQVGTVCTIDLNAAGAVRGRFLPVVIQQGREVPGGEVVVESGPGVVPPERWTRIALEYDRRELVLLVDGVPVARTAETAPVWPIDGPLVLSDARRPFPGAIDALVIAAVVAGEEARLPESVRLAEGTPDEVLFDAGGGLDRAQHAEPVAIVLEFDDGARETISVGRYGTVE